MGQEIEKNQFHHHDFERFKTLLAEETAQLKTYFKRKRLSRRRNIIGLEAEAWLIDANGSPWAINDRFLNELNDPMVVPELAKFNFELNVAPTTIEGPGLATLEKTLAEMWERCQETAQTIGATALSIGTLPTARPHDFTLANMSPLNRYRALNEQVLRARVGRPLMLDITGEDHFHIAHNDVMLESATTSFQLHWQLPAEEIARYFNASIAASFATVAVAANSPFLFGKQLWAESRIPLFEQAVEVGGYDGAAHGPVRRVTFGSGYIRKSLLELFDENAEHYPVLLPICTQATSDPFTHLRLHNGTVWRWNRPLLGVDDDGKTHARIEHRVMAAGPSVADQLSNAAFYYGLTHWLANHAEGFESAMPFTTAKLNFYAAAQHGLSAHVHWLSETPIRLKVLILDHLIPAAAQGLNELDVDDAVATHYLDIIEKRIRSEQTGSAWQIQFANKHDQDHRVLTLAYARRQATGAPVHEWDFQSDDAK